MTPDQPNQDIKDIEGMFNMTDFERDMRASEPSDVQRGVPPLTTRSIPETRSTVSNHTPLTKQLAQALDDMAAVEKRIRMIMDQINRVKNDVL